MRQIYNGASSAQLLFFPQLSRRAGKGFCSGVWNESVFHCFISLPSHSFPLETPRSDNVNWCTAPPLWHSHLWFCSQAKRKGGQEVKETSQKAYTRHQWVFALFCLLDLEQNKTVNAPSSGSKYLSPDLTRVVLWIMKEFAPCQETALTSKRHQEFQGELPPSTPASCKALLS